MHKIHKLSDMIGTAEIHCQPTFDPNLREAVLPPIDSI